MNRILVGAAAALTEAGTTKSSLSGVACTSMRNCWAGGSDGTGTLLERWNGAAWLVFPSDGGAGAVLTGVACAGVAACWAVGGSLTTGEPGLASRIIEHWNGTAWSLVH